METTVLYIKTDLNSVVQNQSVCIKDITKLYGTDSKLVEQLNNEVILTIPEKKKCKYAMTVLKLIEAIQDVYPNVVVINVGETDFIIEYIPPNRKHKAWELVKTIFVSFAVFFGSAFTIMTFNEDVSVKDVLVMFTSLVAVDGEIGLKILMLCYSIGLPVGIIIFFNHFSKSKMKSDPTPLQVQLRLYEENENKAILENASREGELIDSR